LQIVAEILPEEMMLNSVAALLKLMGSKASPLADGRRFWALVLQSLGDSALLESGGKKISAKLETAVSPGERLHLEQLFTSDGKLHCKILHRLPAAEPGTLPVNSFYMFWHREATRRTQYLLTSAEEEGIAGCAGGEQQWRFTLYTENLGPVTILAGNMQGRIECNILVEHEAAATSLAHLVKLFPPALPSGPVLRGIRVLRQGENSNQGSTGGCLDRVR